MKVVQGVESDQQGGRKPGEQHAQNILITGNGVLFRRLAFRGFGWSQSLVQEGVEQAAKGNLTLHEIPFQLIAHRYQLIDLGDNAKLFPR